MTLLTDIPTRAELEQLLTARSAACVSLYLPTSPLSRQAQGDRIVLKNLAGTALEQLRAAGAAREDVELLEEAFDDLVGDDEFWAHQARSLAVFASPRGVVTFRLPNTLTEAAEVSDRFHVKPLLRAVTFPDAGFVLALSQGAIRLLEIAGDGPPQEVRVPGLPDSVAGAVAKASITDRSASGRVQGSEGQKLRMRQYARQVDQALRGVLAGLDVPLVLAATQPLEAIYRSVNSYPPPRRGRPARQPGDDERRGARRRRP